MITVELRDETVKYESSEEGARDIVLFIENIESHSGLIVDCLDIDGIKVYSDYDKYIMGNFESIENIRVNLITEEEFVADILDTSYSYMQGAAPGIQQIVNSLYTGEKNAKLIDDLSSLLEGIAWIFSVGGEVILKYSGNDYISSMLSLGYKENIMRLEEAFAELKNAIMNMDYILIADVLNYEVLDAFNNIMLAIRKIRPEREN